MRKRFLAFFVLLLTLFIPGSALAQDYYFQAPIKTVDVWWNEDGTSSILYIIHFENDINGHAIEYVDIGIPNSNFDEGSIQADVDGTPLYDISRSGYQGDGSGVAVGLGSASIPPGRRGVVKIYIGVVRNVLYPSDVSSDYVSAVFDPHYWGSSTVYGKTDLTVTFHLPPGLQRDEPRWHEAPSGFNTTPQSGFDDEGRIIYEWRNPNANSSTDYKFGADFPLKYVPETAIVKKNPFAWINNISGDALMGWCCFGGIGLFFIGSAIQSKRRRMKYLPPKISIEGHGVKRGLTAVEAAILLEQPLDKVLTMILFSVIKKNAAEVIERDPLKLKVSDPPPEGLRQYEVEFLKAFQLSENNRKREMRDMMVNLVKSISEKLKGFSRRETMEYYRDITKRAWAQVESADIPEVKSQKFNEVLEWTMLDRDFDDRTRNTFRHQPVYAPIWWGRYDPGYRQASVPRGLPSSTPSGSSAPRSTPSLPHLPGSDFAASMVNGVQSFSSKVVGGINEFTSSVTQKTNPPPVTTSSSRSGGSRSSGGGRSCACACACACAGCACACAGGGR